MHCLIANFATVNWSMLIGRLLRLQHRIAWYNTLQEQIQPNMKQMYQGSLGVNIQNLLWPLSLFNGLSQDRSETLSKIGLIIIILQRK